MRKGIPKLTPLLPIVFKVVNFKIIFDNKLVVLFVSVVKDIIAHHLFLFQSNQFPHLDFMIFKAKNPTKP